MNSRSSRRAPARAPARDDFRSRRRAATAEAFVDAAEAVIGRNGFERSTMQDVAREAGCAAGTLYLYFKSKEDLFSAMVSKHCAALSVAHHRAFDDEPDPVNGLRTALRSYLEYFNAHRQFFRTFYTASPGGRAHIPSNLRGDALEAYFAAKRHDVEAFRRAQRKGSVRSDVPAAELVEFIDAVLVVTLARWATADQAPPAETQFDLLWRLISGGLGVREPAR